MEYRLHVSTGYTYLLATIPTFLLTTIPTCHPVLNIGVVCFCWLDGVGYTEFLLFQQPGFAIQPKRVSCFDMMDPSYYIHVRWTFCITTCEHYETVHHQKKLSDLPSLTHWAWVSRILSGSHALTHGRSNLTLAAASRPYTQLNYCVYESSFSYT